MNLNKNTVGALLTLGIILTQNEDAHAYLDPGSGSMLLQLILGGIAGICVLVKLYWKRLLQALGFRKKDN